MSTVSKIDGLASGPQGSEQVFEQRKRFVRMVAFNTTSSVRSLAVGDVMALSTGTSIADGSGFDLDAAFGVGNIVDLADGNSSPLLNAVVGVLSTAVDIPANGHAFIDVQVSGKAQAKVAGSTDAAAVVGDLFVPSNVAGQSRKEAGHAEVAFAIALTTSAASDGALCDVMLLNPLNY